VYPTLWEGFGLPIVEAMSQGAAVISSNVSAVPEILGDAGLLIDPRDVESLAAAMRRLEEEPALRGELVERAARRARRFSWQEAARKVAEIYREALARPRYADASS
ncbi:MAG TPA: glycosyltransferase, partial [Alphaproteobacteria bacterium]|nr:glycosyltransferase [Alphaproteobacteria bacterium]